MSKPEISDIFSDQHNESMEIVSNIKMVRKIEGVHL